MLVAGVGHVVLRVCWVHACVIAALALLCLVCVVFLLFGCSGGTSRSSRACTSSQAYVLAVHVLSYGGDVKSTAYCEVGDCWCSTLCMCNIAEDT
jgi:hypothetical protein